MGVIYHYDLDCRGLAISVGKTGRKTFLIYRKVEAKPYRKSLGPYPDLPIDEARRRVAELNGQIAAGKNPLAPRNQSATELTLRQAFAKYYAEYSSVHKVTHLEDKAHFQRHVEAPKHAVRLAHLPLSAITPADIRSLHLALGEKGKRTTANRIIALLSSIFNKCGTWGYGPSLNPCRGLRRFPERSRTRFIQPREMQRFLAALEAEPNDTARDFFKLALFTGARRSNVLTMMWHHVDLERRVWNIPRTKNGDGQVVHLSAPAVSLLEARKLARERDENVCAYVLPGRGKQGHFVEPKSAWVRVLMRGTALGITEALRNKLPGAHPELVSAVALLSRSPEDLVARYRTRPGFEFSQVSLLDLHVHDLRRTLGSWLASGGTSLVVIGRALNHKTAAATQVYARIWDEAVRDAVEVTGSAFLAKREI
jgi:integrase